MSRYDLILKNGSVVLPSSKIEKLDIGVLNSKIEYLGVIDSENAEQVIDISSLHVLPGCIDTQVHFREPGLTHKEDLSSGTKGAVLGGITGIFEMPNTYPPTITKDDFEFKVNLGLKKSYCDFSFFIGAAKENIDKLKLLEKLPGCCGIKIFMGSSTGDLLVEDDDSLERILSKSTRRIAIHSEDEYRLRDRKHIIEKDDVSVHEHEIWRDVTTAYQSTERLLKIAKKVGRKIHILHISTAEELEIIEENKSFATAEATPQHLFFSSPECYDNLGSLAQMNPPIRGKIHQDSLWKGIQRGIIDVIGSDHAPHTLKEKRQKYPKSPSGMTGVQTLVPIMLDFVNKGKLSIFDFVKLTSTNPTKIYNIKNKGKIEVGYDADFTIVDMKKNKKIRNDWIASKSGWSPYNEINVVGWPIYTIIRGHVIMRDDQIVNGPIGKIIEFSDIV